VENTEMVRGALTHLVHWGCKPPHS
jgi:hypothetical protein